MKGILINEHGDLLINVRLGTRGMISSGLAVGENAVQCAWLVLQINQGELKEDPIIGSNLLRNIRGKLNQSRIKNQVEIALMRANINIEEVRNEIDILVNKQSVAL